jgi:glycerate kinase
VGQTALVRILVAPDTFAGTLTAAEAAEAVRDGWNRTAPDDACELLPLSDGGPGFVEVLHASLGGDLLAATVPGPLGEPTPAGVLLHEGTGYVECAQAAGLHLLDPADRDPSATTTYGVGELIALAVDAGATRVVVGLGGSATNDGGAGALAALGATPDEPMRRGGAALADVPAVDLSAAQDRLRGVELVIASDVDAPLLGDSGASHGFGEQKGADRATRERLEEAMRAWATTTDGGVAVRPGAGAAGGLGFGLMLLGATRVPGAQLAVDATRLAERAAECDLLISGEGAFDWQSLRGKVVAGVARVGLETGRPVVVLAGRVEVGRRELSNAGIDSAYAVGDLDRGEQGHTAADGLRALAARVARTWSR